LASDHLLEGLAIKVGPLGEHDRLVTVLSDREGLSRLAAPGARRLRSPLAAVCPFTLLELQVVGRRGLRRMPQARMLRSFGRVGQRLVTLASAQTLAELAMALVPEGEPSPGLLDVMTLHLGQLEQAVHEEQGDRYAVAVTVKGCLQLLALGGYALPLQCCCRSGLPLDPPLGDWQWRCSLLGGEGLAVGSLPQAALQMNASELAVLQRLLRPQLPKRRTGELMGPEPVWLHLLACVTSWVGTNLQRELRAASVLRSALAGPVLGPELSEHGPT